VVVVPAARTTNVNRPRVRIEEATSGQTLCLRHHGP
jgi:hypothetical protein